MNDTTTATAAPVGPQRLFLLEQKFTPLVNRYELFRYDGVQKGERLAFVEQKRFTLKEQMTAWTSEAKSDVYFTLKAEKVLDVHGKFLVSNGADQNVGYLKKAFGASLLRSTWEVYDANNQLLMTATERNLVGAIVRRLGGFVPFVGELLEQLPFNFDFMVGASKVGHSTRKLGLRDTYEVALYPDAPAVDDRLIGALALALDAMQAR